MGVLVPPHLPLHFGKENLGRFGLPPRKDGVERTAPHIAQQLEDPAQAHSGIAKGLHQNESGSHAKAQSRKGQRRKDL